MSIFLLDKVIIQNVQASGTGGGFITVGDWRTTPLNTIAYDRQTTPSPWMTLASNQFTLQPGVYHLDGLVQSYATQDFQGRIQNVTTNTNVFGGQRGRSNDPDNVQGTSKLNGIINTDSVNSYELQVQVSASSSTDRGLGVETNNGVDNIYSQIEITKLK